MSTEVERDPGRRGLFLDADDDRATHDNGNLTVSVCLVLSASLFAAFIGAATGITKTETE